MVLKLMNSLKHESFLREKIPEELSRTNVGLNFAPSHFQIVNHSPLDLGRAV